jgi:KUP system potassium uptake protein
MGITTVLFFIVVRERWKWPRWKAVLICGTLLVIDLSFWGANLIKIIDGGWVPLAVGLFIFIMMTTWKKGRKLLGERIRNEVIPLSVFLDKIDNQKSKRYTICSYSKL